VLQFTRESIVRCRHLLAEVDTNDAIRTAGALEQYVSKLTSLWCRMPQAT